METQLTIVLPVFNDWPSFLALLQDLNHIALQQHYRLSIVVADDGSTDPVPSTLYALGVLPQIDSVLHVQLGLNLGHQRALAVGLCAALEDPAAQHFLIMDADGEDRPQDIPFLMASARSMPNAIAVAKRRRRTERLSFRLFYKAYKAAFLILTGKEISFGNFSLLSRDHVERLTMVSELWNNLPAAMMRSRLPIQLVPTDRGKRYYGASKMGFVALTLHGISAYSVYTDAILVRLLIGTFLLSLAGAGFAGGVSVLRLFFPHYATPGWATTVVFGVAIIISQAMFTTLMTALLLLNSRSQRLLIPATDCLRYIRSRRLLPLQRIPAEQADPQPAGPRWQHAESCLAALMSDCAPDREAAVPVAAHL